MNTEFKKGDVCVFGTTEPALKGYNGEKVVILDIVNSDNVSIEKAADNTTPDKYKVRLSNGRIEFVYARELAPISSIGLVVYNFRDGDVYISNHSIVKETPMIYHTEKYRFYKESLGDPVKKIYSGATYLEIAMFEGTEDLLLAKLSEWFTEMSTKIFDAKKLYS